MTKDELKTALSTDDKSTRINIRKGYVEQASAYTDIFGNECN